MNRCLPHINTIVAKTYKLVDIFPNLETMFSILGGNKTCFIWYNIIATKLD